jgi:hypothetical protein
MDIYGFNNLKYRDDKYCNFCNICQIIQAV